jgi:hypothetical protein
MSKRYQLLYEVMVGKQAKSIKELSERQSRILDLCGNQFAPDLNTSFRTTLYGYPTPHPQIYTAIHLDRKPPRIIAFASEPTERREVEETVRGWLWEEVEDGRGE